MISGVEDNNLVELNRNVATSRTGKCVHRRLGHDTTAEATAESWRGVAGHSVSSDGCVRLQRLVRIAYCLHPHPCMIRTTGIPEKLSESLQTAKAGKF